MADDRIAKIMKTAWVTKYIQIYMDEGVHTKGYIPQDNTKVSDDENFDCVTLIENPTQRRAYLAFLAEYLDKYRPDIRAGVIYLP